MSAAPWESQFPPLHKLTCKDCGAGGSVVQDVYDGPVRIGERSAYRCALCTVKEEERRASLQESDVLKRIDHLTEEMMQLRQSVMTP